MNSVIHTDLLITTNNSGLNLSVTKHTFLCSVQQMHHFTGVNLY